MTVQICPNCGRKLRLSYYADFLYCPSCKYKDDIVEHSDLPFVDEELIT